MGEYALIIGLVALVVIIGVTALGTNLRDVWTVLTDNIPGTIPG
jgi:Flp pilus assembly pilin Flp